MSTMELGEEEEDCCDMPCCLCAPYKDEKCCNNVVCMQFRKSAGTRLVLGFLLGFILGMLLAEARPVSPGARFCAGRGFNAFTSSDPCYNWGVADNINFSELEMDILNKQLPLCLDDVCTKTFSLTNMHNADTEICLGTYGTNPVKTFLAIGNCDKLDTISQFTRVDEDGNKKTTKDTYYISTADTESLAGGFACLSFNENTRTSHLALSEDKCPDSATQFSLFTENPSTRKSLQDQYNSDMNDFKRTIDYTFAFWAKLWLNSLKLVVLPLLIANIITSTSDLKEIPDAGKLGCYTFLYYLTTTISAAIEAIILCSIFLIPFLKKLAPNTKAYSTPNKEYTNTGEQITGVINSIVPSNIVRAVVGDPGTNYLGIIFFCILVGISLPRKTKDKNGTLTEGVFLMWFRELNEMMLKIINVIILITPLGVFLFTVNVYATHDITDILTRVSLFLATVFTGLAMHMLVVYPSIYFVLTRNNPFRYLMNLSDCIFTSLAIASSLATLPVTLRCAKKNGIQDEIAKFVLSLGATVNMDGTTIGFPCAVIFVAIGEGMTITFGQIIVIVLLSTVSSMGAAPIPQAGLVLLVLILDNLGIPTQGGAGIFGLVVAVDWLYDRPETTVNVVGDSFAAGVMDHYFRKNVSNEQVATEEKDATEKE